MGAGGGQKRQPNVLLASLPLLLLVCATMVCGAGASSRNVHLVRVQPPVNARGRPLQLLFLLFTRLRPIVRVVRAATIAFKIEDEVYDLEQQLCSIPDSGGQLCFDSDKTDCQDINYFVRLVKQARCSWAGYYPDGVSQVDGENCLDQLSAKLSTISQQHVLYSGLYYHFDSEDSSYQCSLICEGGGSVGPSSSPDPDAGSRAHISLNAAFVGALGATALGLGML